MLYRRIKYLLYLLISINICGGRNSLEAESLQPNSPLGERINDDDEISILKSDLELNSSELNSTIARRIN